ncbi:MAG: MATE family efflux transporter [Blautia sp.]|nr:MATE family efflux transporter [Blautia sp.]
MRNISKTSSYTVDMTEGSPIRHILRFAVPLFIGTVFQQFYSFADTMIAGRCLGDRAIAAIGASAAIYSLLIAFANGLNSGYGIVLSRAFGAGDQSKCRRAVAAMVLLDTVITVLLTFMALLSLKAVLRWLDTPADIFADAYRYIVVILGGMITTILYNMAAGFLRAVGNSRTPLYFLILSCVLNLGMDILFIVVFHMGVGGAAAATVTAQGISAFCCMWYIWRHYKGFLPEKQELVPERGLLSEMLSTGLSMALMLSVFPSVPSFFRKASTIWGHRSSLPIRLPGGSMNC